VRRVLASLVFGWAVSVLAGPASMARASFDAQARAIDGNTVAADSRLLGVDAFERRQLCQARTGC
jgi:micrococcal nuclease